MQEHDDNCPYRPYNCPVTSMDGWNGTLSEMKQHLQSNHKDAIWEDTGVYSKKQSHLYNYYAGPERNLVITFGEVFYVQFRGQDDNYYAFVKYIGPKRSAEQYKSSISIISEDGNEFVTCCYITNNFQEDNEDIITTGKCLRLQSDDVRKFLDNTGNMHVKVEISKIVPTEKNAATTEQEPAKCAVNLV
jgi:hypothetical protein